MGRKVVLHDVSGNAMNPKQKLRLTSVINVLTLPFPSSHVPPVSGGPISAKIVYNKGNIIGN